MWIGRFTVAMLGPIVGALAVGWISGGSLIAIFLGAFGGAAAAMWLVGKFERRHVDDDVLLSADGDPPMPDPGYPEYLDYLDND